LSRSIIGTPHIAGYSLEGKIRATQMVFRQVCKYLGLVYDDTVTIPGITGSKNGLAFTAIEAEDEILRFAVLAGYDVRGDSAALRRILDLKLMERDAYFDDLRRTSTMRREFSAMTIRLPEGHRGLRNRLTALGFELAKPAYSMRL
jgi:erythronate-4-phosphate dehydrogenase